MGTEVSGDDIDFQRAGPRWSAVTWSCYHASCIWPQLRSSWWWSAEEQHRKQMGYSFKNCLHSSRVFSWKPRHFLRGWGFVCVGHLFICGSADFLSSLVSCLPVAETCVLWMDTDVSTCFSYLFFLSIKGCVKRLKLGSMRDFASVWIKFANRERRKTDKTDTLCEEVFQWLD